MPSIEENPEFVAIVDRINREGMSEELMAQAHAIRDRHLEQEQAEAERQRLQQRREQLSKMSTADKIALGLAESKPARGTRVQSDQDRAERDRLRIYGMADETGRKIMDGLAASSPARGSTKPAA